MIVDLLRIKNRVPGTKSASICRKQGFFLRKTGKTLKKTDDFPDENIHAIRSSPTRNNNLPNYLINIQNLTSK